MPELVIPEAVSENKLLIKVGERHRLDSTNFFDIYSKWDISTITRHEADQ